MSAKSLVLTNKPPVNWSFLHHAKWSPACAKSPALVKSDFIILCLSASLTDLKVVTSAHCVLVIITAPGSHTEESDVTTWGLQHIPGLDRNLQQSQMTYNCTLNARKCRWLHLHTQHKPDMLPTGLSWLGNTHLFLRILWLGLLINYKKTFIFMWFPIYVLSKEKLTFMPCFSVK